MKKVILTGCLGLLLSAAYTQETGRVSAGTPYKWGMNGSLEVMNRNLSSYYSTKDTLFANQQRQMTSANRLNGNPHATRFVNIQTECDPNGMKLSWDAVQQFGADMYEVEHSSDGRNWTVAGVVPANRTDFGRANYNFTYYKALNNVLVRIKAKAMDGEYVYSEILDSPCSIYNAIGVTPNPVYSTANVRIGSPMASRAKVSLVNSAGAVVHTQDLSLSMGANDLPLNMNRLPAGQYTLYIQWMNGKQREIKILKR